MEEERGRVSRLLGCCPGLAPPGRLPVTMAFTLEDEERDSRAQREVVSGPEHGWTGVWLSDII